MAPRIGEKRRPFNLASELEEEEEDDDDDDDDDNSDDEDDTASTSCDDDGDESESVDLEYEKDDSSDDNNNNSDNQGKNEPIYDKIIRLLREGSHLQELNLADCKAYLRSHELRLSGAKEQCIQRIKEHWRINDGNGEVHYPRSSFNINCTGDACKGDVVLFTQKVYQRFYKCTRRGNVLGKRTVAGRIVKESYGAAKQQHTFTIEVLWSKGIKKLPPLSPLLVKGRNLYKMRTFRQRWKNESERLKVLDEKHKRGNAARHVRAMKKSKANEGAKRQKQSHNRPSQMKQAIQADNGKRIDQQKKKNTSVRNYKSNNRHKKVRPVEQQSLTQSTVSRSSTSYRKYQNFTHPNGFRDPTFHSYSSFPQDPHHSHREFQHQREPLCYPCDMGSTSSMMRFPHSRPYADQGLKSHGSYPQYDYSSSIHESRERNYSGFPGSMDSYGPLYPFPYCTEIYGQRRYGF